MTIWIVTMNFGFCDPVVRPVLLGQYICLNDPAAQVVCLVKSMYWLYSIRFMSVARSYVFRSFLGYHTDFRSQSSQVLGGLIRRLLFSYLLNSDTSFIRLLSTYAVILSPKSWLIVTTTTNQATVTMRTGTSMVASKSVGRCVSEQ
jgi:hypothetical protein